VTDLHDRLDDLARGATSGLELAHPGVVAPTASSLPSVSRAQPSVLRAAAVLVVLGLTIATFALIGRGDDASDPVTAGPPVTPGTGIGPDPTTTLDRPVDPDATAAADSAAITEACAALGPLVVAFEQLTPVDAATMARLARAARAVDDSSPPFAALAVLLDALPDAVVSFDDLRTANELSPHVHRATDECAARAVPGWVVEYVDPEPSLAAAVQLPSRIDRQTLNTTDEVLANPPTGPGLGPITRIEVQGEDVAVFRWTDDAGDVVLDCLSIVDVLGRQATGCDPVDSDAPRRIGDRMELSPGSAYAFVQTVMPETAYVVVEVGQRSWLQEPVGGIVALRIARGAPIDDPVVTEYGADGEVLRRS
jgi:hypothetical protein